jgi:cysteine synthase
VAHLGFIPGALDTEIYDEIVQVPSSAAIDMARRLATEEGMLCGISSGAAVIAAIVCCERSGNVHFFSSVVRVSC